MSVRIKGRIKKLVSEKGFGFITPEDGSKDVFFHMSALVDGVHYDDLNEGDQVEFNVVPGKEPGKVKADEVKLSFAKS